MLKLFSSLLLFSIFFYSHASALTIGVPGVKPTIQAGIDAASPGDTVLVQPGTYYETIDFKGKNIVVGSMWLAKQDTSYISQTIIDANKKGTVVTFKNGETEKAEICGFTITNGYTTFVENIPGIQVLSPGGGIFCKNASPYIHHLTVSGNEVYYDGGGMYLEKSNSVIEYCVIEDNRATIGSGGGIYLKMSGKIFIRQLTINNNFAVDGDGIFCLNSKPDFIKIDKVLFYNNYNSIYIAYSSVDITNCTIFDLRNGYAVRSVSSFVNIINTILCAGGQWGIYSYVDPQFPGSIIAVSHSEIKNGISSVGKGTQDSLYWFDGNISSDPLFIDTLHNNFYLQKVSPCIDAGTSFFSFNNRTVVDIQKELYKGKFPDIGALESEYTSTIVKDNNAYNLSLSNYPNPFNSTSIICIYLPEPCHTHLAIYTSNGQKVIDLLNKNLFMRNHITQWSGLDEYGRKTSSGIYIIKLDAGIHSLTKRIVYIK